ncbi:hypothetical protein RHSIM_Rhsim08G0219200 [Rhododendron simsii]|uniref:Uncharacterized protein n=1 Tax=Rhododendron simsii TaxID=118357 RepID=A0A834GK56_RHOSS|nr:hypothetical protein RHSIM_Rhsim08G0219200 [Rhododendron simsii]
MLLHRQVPPLHPPLAYVSSKTRLVGYGMRQCLKLLNETPSLSWLRLGVFSPESPFFFFFLVKFVVQVLGMNVGGTKDIVEHDKTSLLLPLGHLGAQVLSANLQFLFKNPLVRQKMGMRGREKVEKIYLKRHMYKEFARVLSRCMDRI